MMVFGTVGLFVRRIPLSSSEIALYRAGMALIVLTLIMLVTGRFQGAEGHGEEGLALFLFRRCDGLQLDPVF